MSEAAITERAAPDDSLYEQDFLMWTQAQGEALRRAGDAGLNASLDWENLAEEVESLGRSERNRVRSLVQQIVVHLLKHAHARSPVLRIGWETEISLFRDQLGRTLADSPSLRPALAAIITEEVPRAIRAAARSLEKHGEADAAARIRGGALALTAEDILDDDMFLPPAETLEPKELIR